MRCAGPLPSRCPSKPSAVLNSPEGESSPSSAAALGRTFPFIERCRVSWRGPLRCVGRAGRRVVPRHRWRSRAVWSIGGCSERALGRRSGSVRSDSPSAPTSRLLGYRRKEPVTGDVTCRLFTRTHGHRKTVGKTYRCQYNVGKGNIQWQRSGAQALLDLCCITSGWQVVITLCKVSAHFPAAVCETAKRATFSL